MSEDLTKPIPHPHFENLKDTAWEYFINKDYENTARTAALILQNSHAFDGIHLAGLALCALDRDDEGFDWLVASLSLSRGRPDWYANAVIAMIDKKDFLRAMLFAKNGHDEYPTDIRLCYMRGLIMCHSQQWENAIVFLDETMALDDTFYHARMSKGFACHMLGRYEEAIELYKSIYYIDEGADREEVVNNHACVLLEMGMQEESLALLDKEYPNSTRPGTLYNKSFLYLGMGRWPEAFHLYRYRSMVQMSADIMPSVEQPTAQTLEDIKGKHLFFFHEQGLGDSLMFIRYAALLRPYVSEMTIGVPKTLQRLAECLILDDFAVVPEGDQQQVADLEKKFTVISDGEVDKPIFSRCDVALPMLDAPAILNTTLDTIPATVPYFKIPENIISKHLLPDTCKPRIGLVWAGSSRPENIRAHSIDKRRSIPFEMFEPLLKLSDRFDFISLQLPDQYIENEPRMIQPLSFGGKDPGYRDVLDTAGVVAQLDLVISIDSAMAHLSGALNKPTWMLSRWDGCWRWFWSKEEEWNYSRTQWYPKMRIFRQKAHNTWPTVIEEVVDRLKSMTDSQVESLQHRDIV